MYMTTRRLYEDEDLASAIAHKISSDPELHENDAYFKLIELYTVEDMTVDELLSEINVADLSAEDVTIGYGLVNWLMLEGRDADAGGLRDAILRSRHKYAFGFIAAEQDSRFAGPARPSWR
jgi:hypothetical protein